jgi:serine carboxypeptidase 1
LADLIFIDNPVGTGYSYVDDDRLFTHSIRDIAADLLSWAKV